MGSGFFMSFFTLFFCKKGKFHDFFIIYRCKYNKEEKQKMNENKKLTTSGSSDVEQSKEQKTDEKKIYFARNVQDLGVGYKKGEYKREKEKKEYQYLTRKQFKPFKQEQEERGKDYPIDGFAKIKKKFKDKGDNILSINGDKFDHYNKRRFFSYTKQYVRTGENSFTKIQRSLAVIIIPILLVTSMLVGLTFIPSKPDKPHMPWTPVIEDTTGNSDNNGEEQRPAGIQVKGFTEWTIPANKTEGLGIDLENPDGNPCYFSFEIKLKDSGEVIYKSSMVPPGEKIHKIDISREFSQGDYPIIIHIYTNELETGAEMNSPEMQVTMHVK